MRILIISIIVVILIVIPIVLYSQLTLGFIEKWIEKHHPVRNLDAALLYEKITGSDSTDYLLFDTRLAKEYNVSHLRNSLRVGPNMSAEDFIRQYGDTSKNKHLVFYCSVGYRSSLLVERLQEHALESGSASLSSLQGGIFRWYNSGYPVFKDSRETNDIHPYQLFWKKLIDMREE